MVAATPNFQTISHRADMLRTRDRLQRQLLVIRCLVRVVDDPGVAQTVHSDQATAGTGSGKERPHATA